MKWTEVSRSWVPCPCRSGKVVTIREADENRQLRKRSILECERCEEMELESWSNDLHQQDLREKELHQIYEKIDDIFRRQYHHYWMDHFGLCSSKRAVWEILRGSGIYGKSLTSFYEELRSRPLPYYLNELPDSSNIHLILQLLEIEDDELLELLRRKHRLENQKNI